MHIEDGTSEISRVGGYRTISTINASIRDRASADHGAIAAIHRNVKNSTRKTIKQNRIISDSICSSQKHLRFHGPTGMLDTGTARVHCSVTAIYRDRAAK